LGASKLPAPALCLEVTETAVAGGIERLAEPLGRLRDLGVRIAVDDFGRGHSALSYLRALPVDVVKIDRSFVAGLAHAVEDR
ncbi:EAL domain-containing protein, partial [Escherichia coli]|nr:EAL domain-containing protein [Escherichia coli]